jgi:hypothetical protein
MLVWSDWPARAAAYQPDVGSWATKVSDLTH